MDAGAPNMRADGLAHELLRVGALEEQADVHLGLLAE